MSVAHTLKSALGGAVKNGNHALADQVRAELKAANAADYIRRLVDEAPPLTSEQRDRLAVLLRPSAA